MHEMARWSMAIASASSAMLRRGHGNDELELWLYLGLNGDARGSARWSEEWWSCVRELSKNGVAAVACELGGGRRQWHDALWLRSSAAKVRKSQSNASESK